jgi:hypothetical protein
LAKKWPEVRDQRKGRRLGIAELTVMLTAAPASAVFQLTLFRIAAETLYAPGAVALLPVVPVAAVSEQAESAAVAWAPVPVAAWWDVLVAVVSVRAELVAVAPGAVPVVVWGAIGTAAPAVVVAVVKAELGAAAQALAAAAAKAVMAAGQDAIEVNFARVLELAVAGSPAGVRAHRGRRSVVRPARDIPCRADERKSLFEGVRR